MQLEAIEPRLRVTLEPNANLVANEVGFVDDDDTAAGVREGDDVLDELDPVTFMRGIEVLCERNAL